ncbi:MAG: TonB-dependent receptor [Bacteroidetes bacterium]|nr:TonB-dependent receptor [Bacteroidota bacterium]
MLFLHTIKRRILYLCLLCVGLGTLHGDCQVVTVLDRTTLQPVDRATITGKNSKIIALTGPGGKADISSFPPSDSIIIRSIGYQTEVLGYRTLEAMYFRVLLKEKIFSLDQVVISASRFEEKIADMPQQVDVIKPRDMEFMNQQTSADVMSSTGNIFVQKSQMGGGSPVLRGFEANKVLIVLDGIRMNNAIYRSGHLQNVISIDHSVMDNIEIVFGPGSVVYGSDALGGVMHFHTKNPALADTSAKTLTRLHTFMRTATANSEITGHADFTIGLRKISFLTSYTYSDFGDLRQGAVRNPFTGDWGKRGFYVERINGTDSMLINANPDIQKKTAYSQYDVLEKVLFRQNKFVDHILNFQYSSSSDIDFYARLTQMNGGLPVYAEWFYGPQKRLLGAYTLKISKENFFFKNGRVIASFQSIEESRHSRKFKKDILSHRTENLGIGTLTADFDRVIKKNEFRYGCEGVFNSVQSIAGTENIVTGETGPLDTRYPDGGSEVQNLAVYVTHTLEVDRTFILADGLRYSNNRLSARFIDTTFFPFPFDEIKQTNNAVTGNLGFILLPGREWRITLNGSTGFRNPNVDDLGKIFESVPGNIIVPNPDLKPEYTYTFETGVSKFIQNTLKLEGIVFYTLYRDAITLQPWKFNGQDSILYDGVMSRVTANVNALEAYITGFSGSLLADVTPAFSIVSNLNYTYGRITGGITETPLDHIPPLFGRTSFNLKLDKFRGEFFILYNGWKRKEDYNIAGEDNFAYATSYGTPAWYTLNIRTAYQLDPRLQLQVSLENILDTYYRVFASGVSAPGRNLVVTVRGRL